MAFTYTRTTTKEPEIEDKSSVSLEPPTRDEIVEQLTKHFTNRPQDVVTEEDIFKITDRVIDDFVRLKDEPYRSFAKYDPQKPALSIITYNNEWLLYERENYPVDYSPIRSYMIRCSIIDFHVTVVEYTKQIRLAYVSR